MRHKLTSKYSLGSVQYARPASPSAVERKFDQPASPTAGQASAGDNFRVLIFGVAIACKFKNFAGKNGWLGGLLGNICKQKGIPYAFAKARLEEKHAMLAELADKRLNS